MKIVFPKPFYRHLWWGLQGRNAYPTLGVKAVLHPMVPAPIVTEIAGQDHVSHLPQAAARLHAALSRPKWVAIGCVVTLAGFGWIYLGVASATGGDGQLWQQICGPFARGLPHDPRAFMLVFAMWSAMALAMMLPSAGPMIVTYAEIAETAARKDMRVVSPFVLTAGYASVWLVFAMAAALLQLVLSSFGALQSPPPAMPWLSAALFAVAGLYQFSVLKQSCLHVCQRPFPFFFTHWATTPSGVFRLGLQQGLYCLGCCWALMLFMFVTGAMNVIWMIVLGIVMTIEKISNTPKFSRAIGAGLIGTAIAIAIGQGWT